MTLQEIVAQLPELTVAERRALRDAIDQSLAVASAPARERAEAKGQLDEMEKPETKLPPDWDWKEEYIDYLVKKYS